MNWFKKKQKQRQEEFSDINEAIEVKQEVMELTPDQKRLKKIFNKGVASAEEEKRKQEKYQADEKGKYQQFYDENLSWIKDKYTKFSVYSGGISISKGSHRSSFNLTFHGSGYRLSNVWRDCWLEKTWDAEFEITFGCKEQLMEFLGYWITLGNVPKAVKVAGCACVVYDADNGEVIKTINIQTEDGTDIHED